MRADVHAENYLRHFRLALVTIHSVIQRRARLRPGTSSAPTFYEQTGVEQSLWSMDCRRRSYHALRNRGPEMMCLTESLSEVSALAESFRRRDLGKNTFSSSPTCFSTFPS